jgi:hypothetical protein
MVAAYLNGILTLNQLAASTDRALKPFTLGTDRSEVVTSLTNIFDKFRDRQEGRTIVSFVDTDNEGTHMRSECDRIRQAMLDGYAFAKATTSYPTQCYKDYNALYEMIGKFPDHYENNDDLLHTLE